MSAIALYLLAEATLAFLPQINSGTGSSRITKQITAMRICMFCKPMPSIHGVRVKSTITDKTFRVKTIPTSALPISCNEKKNVSARTSKLI